ncbi:WD40-repeat-containing domain protein [Flagelloscypha sp. PMI_526]|nr:WD40-repeat-containing domain protein [Flagelloscypha sp. PMI_526]
MSHQRKRQKLDVPLEKTEEEKELEAALFGGSTSSLAFLGADDDDSDGQDESGFQFEGIKTVLDEHLFFIDDSTLAGPPPLPTPESNSDDDDDDEPPESAPATLKATSTAWTDPSTSSHTQIPLTSRTRKLRQTADEESLQLSEYEKRLRERFVSMNPSASSWADKARQRVRTEAEENEDKLLLNSTAGILRSSSTKDKILLKSGFLDVQRLRDPNLLVSKLREEGKGGNGEIKSLAFHPSDKVPVLCVASADRRVRLFNVGPSPLFTPPTGSSLLLTSPSRPYWWIWDLEKGSITKRDLNLSSYTDLSSAVDRRTTNKKRRVPGGGGTLNPSFSSSGSVLACSSNNNNVHLVDWERTKTGVIGGFKCTGSGSGTIKSLHWVPKSFVPSSSSVLGAGDAGREENLAVLTSTCQLYIYDVSYMSRPLCVRKWTGGGAAGAGGWTSSTTTSAVGPGLFAVGTNSGYVDMYSSSSSFSTDDETTPKLVKSIANLRTPVSSVKFNHDGQLLAMASRDGGKKAWRLVHTPTLTTYTNFPSPNNPPMSGGVTCFEFSPKDEMLAAGDEKGRVAMWRVGGY